MMMTARERTDQRMNCSQPRLQKSNSKTREECELSIETLRRFNLDTANHFISSLDKRPCGDCDEDSYEEVCPMSREVGIGCPLPQSVEWPVVDSRSLLLQPLRSKLSAWAIRRQCTSLAHPPGSQRSTKLTAPSPSPQSNQRANAVRLHGVVEDISVLGTGTHPDIAATDQIRPIATTTAITMRVCIAFPSIGLVSEVGLAYFSLSQCEVVHNCLAPGAAATPRGHEGRPIVLSWISLCPRKRTSAGRSRHVRFVPISDMRGHAGRLEPEIWLNAPASRVRCVLALAHGAIASWRAEPGGASGGLEGAFFRLSACPLARARAPPAPGRRRMSGVPPRSA